MPYDYDGGLYHSYWYKDSNVPNRKQNYWDDLIQAAAGAGINADEIAALFDMGFDPLEIEDLIYDPDSLREFLYDM